MKKWGLLLVMSLAALSAAEVNSIPNDARVQAAVDDAVAAALDKFASKSLRSNQLAITLIDLRNGAAKGGFRGNESRRSCAAREGDATSAKRCRSSARREPPPGGAGEGLSRRYAKAG